MNAYTSFDRTVYYINVPNTGAEVAIDILCDIMRNATVPVRDRVAEFSYKATGGKIAPLFDGTERVVSIDALHWYNRGVYLP